MGSILQESCLQKRDEACSGNIMPPSFPQESCCSYNPLHDSRLAKKTTMILLNDLYYISDPMIHSSQWHFVQLILSCKQQERCTPTQERQIKIKIAMAVHHSISQHRPKEPQTLFCVPLGQIMLRISIF